MNFMSISRAAGISIRLEIKRQSGYNSTLCRQRSRAAPEGLVKAVRFYEQVKRENPPVETGAWKDAVDWVLKEACCAVILGKADNPLASSNQVGELTMWVKRLVSQLKKANPDCKLPEKAMDYLKRNELISAEDVLR